MDKARSIGPGRLNARIRAAPISDVTIHEPKNAPKNGSWKPRDIGPIRFDRSRNAHIASAASITWMNSHPRDALMRLERLQSAIPSVNSQSRAGGQYRKTW